MPEARDLETIVRHGLCAGCGLCESLAGADRVEMRLTSIGQLRPRQKTELDEATEDAILATCPGVRVTGPPPEQVGEGGVFDPVWGPIRSIHRGWSTNDAIRFESAAGGGMTALGCYLLETGKVDAILHVSASRDDPTLTDAVVSTTPEEVRGGAQSRYGPSSPLRHVHRLLNAGTRFALLAKPCDVAAVRNLEKIDARVEEQIPFLITIFCGGLPSAHTPLKIAGYHGVSAEEIRVFRWRGLGWPGPTHVESNSGKTYDLSYDEAWSTGKPWTYDMQFRCKICPDAIGELGDVACPDAWEIEDGEPIHREADGANLFIARTERGEALVEAAARAGAIHLEPFAVSQLDVMHPDHHPRKLGNPARLEGLAMEGEPVPHFNDFRAEEMVERAGEERHRMAREGTRQRVRQARNREPLT